MSQLSSDYVTTENLKRKDKIMNNNNTVDILVYGDVYKKNKQYVSDVFEICVNEDGCIKSENIMKQEAIRKWLVKNIDDVIKYFCTDGSLKVCVQADANILY